MDGNGGSGAERPAPCFVLPTYCEAANAGRLLEDLGRLHPGPDAAFVVVDDASPDGTADVVRAAARRDPRVRLLDGPGGGLGRAYALGIGWSLRELRPGAIVCMDSDFQHDPRDAARLLGALAAGADVAIGSRYAGGGSLDPGWGAGRRALSAWANRLARRLAGLGGVSDCTSGYRAIRAEALLAADAAALDVRGYAFQIALLHRLVRSGARVREVPIRFGVREHGESKLGARDLAGFLWCALALRARPHPRT